MSLVLLCGCQGSAGASSGSNEGRSAKEAAEEAAKEAAKETVDEAAEETAKEAAEEAAKEESESAENAGTDEAPSEKRLREMQNFDAAGKLSSREVWEYDNSGNLIRRQTYGVDENTGAEEAGEYNTYEYDANGQTIAMCLYDDDGKLEGRFVYERDADGLLQTETLYVEDEVSYSVVYAYDGQGNNISRTRYDKNGLLSSLTEFAYDENGRTVSTHSVNYNEDGSVRAESTQVYEWSEDGRTLRIPWYYSGGSSEGSLGGYSVTVYDEDDNVLENRSEDASQSVQYKTVYIYE